MDGCFGLSRTGLCYGCDGKPGSRINGLESLTAFSIDKFTVDKKLLVLHITSFPVLYVLMAWAADACNVTIGIALPRAISAVLFVRTDIYTTKGGG